MTSTERMFLTATYIGLAFLLLLVVSLSERVRKLEKSVGLDPHEAKP